MPRNRFFPGLPEPLPPAITSSTAGRNTLRLIAGLEIAGFATQRYSLAVKIPQTFAQTLISLSLIFRASAQSHEKGIHILKCLFSLTQLVMLIYLMFSTNEQCKTETDVCKSLQLVTLLDEALLVVFMAVSEGSKKPYEAIPPPVIADPPNPANPQHVVIDVEHHHHHNHRPRHRVLDLSLHSADDLTDDNDDSNNPDAVVHRV